MSITIKNIIKEYIPPVLLKNFNFNRSGNNVWFGDYKNWQDAKNASMGYDTYIILKKVKDAALKVKNGDAVYERDSVIFDKIEYSYPILAALMWIALNKDGKLNIIDFGGSLGTAYFQNRFFLKTLKEVKWNIVEQKHFVKCGRGHFEDGRLKFYESIENCMEFEMPNTILFSGVIQYLEAPYVFLEHVMEKGFEYILFDRTCFLLGEKRDRVTIQRVHSSIYKASYPCWFFNEKSFLNLFEKRYQLIADFVAGDKANIPSVFKGFIFKNKELSLKKAHGL